MDDITNYIAKALLYKTTCTATVGILSTINNDSGAQMTFFEIQKILESGGLARRQETFFIYPIVWYTLEIQSLNVLSCLYAL